MRPANPVFSCSTPAALWALLLATAPVSAPSPAFGAGFSGCIGGNAVLRCCSEDFAPGAPRFPWLRNSTAFGRACVGRGHDLSVSPVGCSLGNKAPGYAGKPVRIECVAPAPSPSPAPSAKPTQRPSLPPLSRFHDVFPSPAGGLIDGSMLGISSRDHFAHGARTYLDYGFVGVGPNYWTSSYLAIARRENLVFQIGMEPYARIQSSELASLKALGMFPGEFVAHRNGPESIEFSLTQMRAALAGKGALRTDGPDARANLRALLYNRLYQGAVAWAELLREHQDVVLVRPLSEMNETIARWQLSNSLSRALEARPGEISARAEVFAAVWAQLREVFREAGAANVRFVFAPLAHAANRSNRSLESVRVTLEALRRIPLDDIDVIGLDVYTSAYSTSAELRDNSFDSLARGWVEWMRSSPGLSTKPLAIAEMGVAQANGSTGVPNAESNRIKWIREAYSSAKAMGFSLVTYFNRVNWACAGTACDGALGDSIRSFQEP